MRLVATEYLSVDGVMDEPAVGLSRSGARSSEVQGKELFATDALLLAPDYEGFAAAWRR